MNDNMNVRYRKSRVDLYSILVNIVIIVLFLSSAFEKVLPAFLNYADEALALVCLAGILVLFVAQGKVKRSIFSMSLCLAALLFIGLLGNAFSNLQSWGVVWADAFLFFKSYFVLLFFLMSLTGERARQILRVGHAVAKALLIMLFVMALLSRFNAFSFWSSETGAFILSAKFYGSVSVWSILFFSMIYIKGGVGRLPYYIMTVVIVLLNASGLGAIILVMIAVSYLLVERSARFHWYYIPVILAIGLLAGWREISDYLLNTNAPRYLLFFYSFVTMGRYFPIGAGFATYGSAMAARHYSPLYYQYGFSSRYWMSPENSSALQDSYYPIIFAQFGVLGTVIFIAFHIILIRRFIMLTPCRRYRSAAWIVLSCLMIAGLGFQALNLWGCAMFMLLALYCKLPDPDASLALSDAAGAEV